MLLVGVTKNCMASFHSLILPVSFSSLHFTVVNASLSWVLAEYDLAVSYTVYLFSPQKVPISIDDK